MLMTAATKAATVVLTVQAQFVEMQHFFAEDSQCLSIRYEAGTKC